MNKFLALFVCLFCLFGVGCRNETNVVEARVDSNISNSVKIDTVQTPIKTETKPTPTPTGEANVTGVSNQSLLQYVENPKIGERFKPFWIDDKEASDNGFEPFCVRLQIDQKTVEKCGFQDKFGKVLIKPNFEKVFVFSEGLAGFCPETEQLCGYIDESEQEVIKANYQFVGIFSEGLAAISIGDVDYYKYGYVNKQGEFVIKPQYSNGEPFKNGIAKVRLRNLSFCIDKINQKVDCVE